jgi:predicted histone-like DNA-binding protein
MAAGGGRVNKWYAKEMVTGRSTIEMIAAAISRSTTVTPTDVIAVIDALWREIIERLRMGQIVELGELGHFKLSIVNNGGSETEDAWTIGLIKGAKILFIPTKTMRDIAKGVGFTRWHNPEEEAARRTLSAAQDAADKAQIDLTAAQTMLARYQKQQQANPTAVPQSTITLLQATVDEDTRLLAEAQAELARKHQAYETELAAVAALHGHDLGNDDLDEDTNLTINN